MELLLAFFLGSLACASASAEGAIDEKMALPALSSSGGFLVRPDAALVLRAQDRNAKTSRNPGGYETALAKAIANAAKKDFIDAGIEASRNMLIECQRETSVVLVTPALRSDSQQAHCYRF